MRVSTHETPGVPFPAAGVQPRRLRLRKLGRRIVFYAVLIAAAIGFMLPFVWLLANSLMTSGEFGATPVRLLPKVPQWRNYIDALTRVNYLTYAGRSLLLSTIFSVANVISSAFAGFGFARHRAPGRNALFVLLLSMMMVPNVVTVIPQFVLYSRLQLVNTYWPWLLWGLAGSPFQIFLFRQFFAGFPRDLEDAAAVDGCNPFRIFWQIFLPNAGPVIAATAIFSFQWVWGDYFFQALFLSEARATLAMKLASAFVDPKGNPLYTLTFAGIVIYILPLIVVYFFAQRQIIRGIVTTGLK